MSQGITRGDIMKYLLVVLLLSLLAAVIVSAKPRRTGRPGNGNRHDHHSNRYDSDSNDSDDNDNDDDDSDDDEKKAEDSTQCFIELMSCYQSLENFKPTPNISEFIQDIHQIGAREACRDLKVYGDCVNNALQEKVCENSLPDEVKRTSRRSLELLDYVCVDRLDDVESHWDCYLNPTVFEELQGCEREAGRGLEQCKPDALINCLDGAFSKIPECSSGASDLVEDVVKKVLNIVPHCSDKKRIARAIMNMFRKK